MLENSCCDGANEPVEARNTTISNWSGPIPIECPAGHYAASAEDLARKIPIEPESRRNAGQFAIKAPAP
jgi:hypothetical protein